MIDAKEAVKIAKQQAVEMLGQGESNLEEIEREDYKNHDVWSITLSFPRPPNARTAMDRLTALSPLQYKRFLIDAGNGELVAMKLRELASQ